MPEHSVEDRLPPSAVFAFLAETLGEVGRRVAGVEALASDVILEVASTDPTRLMALQDLDLIRQMAEDAARLAEVAGRENGGRRSDLAAALRLAALRDRLGSADPPAGIDASGRRPGPSGRVEFFGADGPA